MPPKTRRLIPDTSVEENLCVPDWALKAPDLAERLEGVYRIIPEARAWARRHGADLLYAGAVLDQAYKIDRGQMLA